MLQAEAPWDDLANTAYCQEGSLYVECATVGGVRLPTIVTTGFSGGGLAGALPPSLGELGPLLTELFLDRNAITSVPTELGALTGLTFLGLDSNAITSVPTELGALTGLLQLDLDSNAITAVPSELAALTGLEVLDLSGNLLTGVPTEFRTWGPSFYCGLYGNQGFSCANVGAGTRCCTGKSIPGTATEGNDCGEGLPGGPCYTGRHRLRPRRPWSRPALVAATWRAIGKRRLSGRNFC